MAAQQKFITLTSLEKDYPYRLQFIPNKPAKLWIKGKNLSLFKRPALAVVGSRRPTNYGQQAAKKLVAKLVEKGFVIISGMARGIDSLVHQLTLDNSGQTIAVLGSGLDIIYPPENKKLYNKIQLVTSEFPPGTQPKGNNFLSRNRIISGLSDGLIVIEAARRSGTLNTAKHAAEQGKEVFAIPGPITSPTSEGTAWLIKQGAKLVYDIDDILEELQGVIITTMKKLIIVESPTKARTISRYVGKNFDIVATMGHLRDLPKSKFGVEITKKNSGYKFDPTYTVAKSKNKYASKLKKAAKKAKEIYLAPDPDREGEAIAYHTKIIIQSSKLKVKNSKFKRVSFHEITKKAIQAAMKEPGKIDMNLVDAQQARRILDRLVGYTLSPLLWKKIRRGLSAGRVQSVAVRLIVEREKEIEKFKQEQFYKIWAQFGKPALNQSKPGPEFTAKLSKVDNQTIRKRKKIDLFTGTYTSTKTIYDSPEKAEEVIKDLAPEFEISKITKKDRSRNPFAPYTTSTLQQDASYKLGWSAKFTMSIAQSLFENGHITYHRTDSITLNKGAISATRNVIKNNYGDNYLPKKPRIYKTKSKLAQEAHEAIRPTDVSEKLKVKSKKLNKKENKLYQLVWKRTVACQMASARLAKTRVDLKNRVYMFTVRGSQVKFDGFTKVYPVKLSENILPELKEGQILSTDILGITKHETRAPARYTEASLIAELENHGIGRPSTYAPIISTIRSRNYVEKEKRRFKPTTIGTLTNDFLVKHFPNIMDLPFTAELENSLDDIAKGKKDWQPVVSDFWGPFHKKVDEVEEKADRVKMPVEKTGKKCPECGKGELVIRTGKYGKFLACDRFPDCKYTADYNQKAGFKCPKCDSEVVIKKTKKGARFYSCSKWPDCDWSSWKKPKSS